MKLQKKPHMSTECVFINDGLNFCCVISLNCIQQKTHCLFIRKQIHFRYLIARYPG